MIAAVAAHPMDGAGLSGVIGGAIGGACLPALAVQAAGAGS
jgi:hypothetical protein